MKQLIAGLSTYSAEMLPYENLLDYKYMYL